MQTKIYIITLGIGDTADGIITVQEQVIYRVANIVSQSTMEIWILSILMVAAIVLSYGKINVGSSLLETSANMLRIMYILYIIDYVVHTNTLPNCLDALSIYPLYTNNLVAIHPMMLIASLTMAIMANDTGIYASNSKYNYKYGVTNIVSVYTLMSLAVIFGGIWASALFGWGGFWIWDPVETIIITKIYIMLRKIHDTDTIMPASIYTIWYIAYAKTSIINGIHSVNAINVMNTRENIIVWLCIYTIMLMYLVDREGIMNRHFSISSYVPIIILTANHYSEHMNVTTMLYIPTNIISIILWYIFIYYIISKIRSTKNDLIFAKELIYSFVVYAKIVSSVIIDFASVLCMAIINIIVTTCMSNKKKKYYILDHTYIAIIIIMVITYMISNIEYYANDFVNYVNILELLDIIMDGREYLRKISGKLEISQLLNNGMKDYYISFVDDNIDNEIFIDLVVYRNGVFSANVSELTNSSVLKGDFILTIRAHNLIIFVCIITMFYKICGWTIYCNRWKG